MTLMCMERIPIWYSTLISLIEKGKLVSREVWERVLHSPQMATSRKVWDTLKFETRARHLGMEQSKKIWGHRFSQTAYGKSPILTIYQCWHSNYRSNTCWKKLQRAWVNSFSPRKSSVLRYPLKQNLKFSGNICNFSLIIHWNILASSSHSTSNAVPA